MEIVWITAIESIPELKSYCIEILGYKSFCTISDFYIISELPAN